LLACCNRATKRVAAVPRRVSVLQPTANSYYAPRLRPRPPRFPDDCKLITVSLAYLLLIIIQSTPKSADLLLTRPVAESPVWRHSGRPAKESRNVVAFSNPSCITHHASRITHHIAAGYQGEVYCMLKAEEIRGTACHLCRPLPRPASSCRAPNPARRRWEAKTHHVDSVRLSIAVYSSCSEALTDCCRDASATKPPTTRRRPSA
jgi:hypothetical protein